MLLLAVFLAAMGHLTSSCHEAGILIDPSAVIMTLEGALTDSIFTPGKPHTLPWSQNTAAGGEFGVA